MHGPSEVVRTLLAEGAQTLNCLDKNNWSPLSLAAHMGHAATARLLVEAGADINASRGERSETALHEASGNHPNHPSVVSVLLELRAEVERLRSEGRELAAAAKADV